MLSCIGILQISILIYKFAAKYDNIYLLRIKLVHKNLKNTCMHKKQSEFLAEKQYIILNFTNQSFKLDTSFSKGKKNEEKIDIV